MLPLNSPFELDRELIILRNNSMYKHFSKLNLIRNRNNKYLPKIKIKYQNKNKNKINNNLLLFSIKKENEALNNKINQIRISRNKKYIIENKNNKILKQRNNTRENVRKYQLDLLIKTNNEIKNRIKNVHPVINHKKLIMDYLESRKIYYLNRKIKPSLSWGNDYFTKEDYSYMEKYENNISEQNKKALTKSSFYEKNIKLKRIKLKKLGLSISGTKIK